MSKIISNLLTYPARWTGAVGTFLGAFYILGGAFEWWHWTSEQATAVTGATTAALGLVTALGVHALVTPNAKLGIEPPPAELVDPPPDGPYEPQIDADAVAAAIPPPAAPDAGEADLGAVDPPP